MIPPLEAAPYLHHFCIRLSHHTLVFSSCSYHHSVLHRRRYSVTFSPDGTRIVTGSGDLTAKVWDARTGTPPLDLRGHPAPVVSARFSPDGKRIVTGSDDGTIRIWDASTGAPVTEPLAGHKKMVDSVAYSLDGKRIVSSVPTTGRCGYGMPPPANRSVSR